MKASSHFLHESNSARRISVDIASIILIVVGNKLIFEYQDYDESGGGWCSCNAQVENEWGI